MNRIRSRQSGKFNIVTLITVVVLTATGYIAMKVIPVYIEKSRISRLIKAAGNQWMNVDSNLENVKADLNRNLTDGGITYVTADDVNFVRLDNDTVEVWVKYKVSVKHFWSKIKPTKFKFKLDHKVKKSVSTEG